MMMTASVPAPMYTLFLLRSANGQRADWRTRSALRRNDRRLAPERWTSLPSVDERERRIAENEAYWRQVNELSPPEPGMLNLMFCECGRLDCRERVAMTVSEYEAVRSSATTFVISPGHAIPDVEWVVETTERFEVVEKEGEAARVAIETEPG